MPKANFTHWQWNFLILISRSRQQYKEKIVNASDTTLAEVLGWGACWMWSLCKLEASEQQYKQVSLQKFWWVKEQHYKYFTIHFKCRNKIQWYSEDKRNSPIFITGYMRESRAKQLVQLQLCVLKTNLQGMCPIDLLSSHPILWDQWQFAASYRHSAFPLTVIFFRSSNIKLDVVSRITIMQTER